MSDTLHDKLWRAMQAHGVGWIYNGTDLARCYCGHRPDRLVASWHAHVADAVIAGDRPRGEGREKRGLNAAHCQHIRHARGRC